MKHILEAAKETAKYWGVPVLVAFAIELLNKNKEIEK